MPDFELEEIEDFYTYYVQILKIPESLFWYADVSFIERVVANKAAYDGWVRSVMEAERKKSRG